MWDQGKVGVMKKLFIMIVLLVSCGGNPPDPDEPVGKIVTEYYPLEETFILGTFPYTVEVTVGDNWFRVDSLIPFDPILLSIIEAYKERIAELHEEVRILREATSEDKVSRGGSDG